MAASDLFATLPLPFAPAPRAAELLAARQAALRHALRPYLDEMLERLGLPAGAVVVGYAGGAGYEPVCIPDDGMPAPATADRVILCQFMSMAPDWRQSLDAAMTMLKPGGRIGVLDFHLPRHGPRLVRGFWRAWFRRAVLRLRANHLANLRYRCLEHVFAERHVAVPGLPGLRAPCYWFVGKAPAADSRRMFAKLDRLVIFDADGTLVDAFPAIETALATAWPSATWSDRSAASCSGT